MHGGAAPDLGILLNSFLDQLTVWGVWFWTSMKSVVHWIQANWEEISSTAWLVFALLAVCAVIGGLLKLKIIAGIIRDFRDARGPIWDLRETVSQVQSLEPVIGRLSEDLGLVTAQIETLQKQFRDQELESLSARLEDKEANTRSSVEDQNWETLRSYWRRNTERIEHVISQISDGRTKLSFTRMPRTNYPAIIRKLDEAKQISSAAATASVELIRLFNSYRPRSQKVPDSVVGTLKLLDNQLNSELVDFALLNDVYDGVESAAPRPVAPVSLPVGNGSSSREVGPIVNLPEDRAI